MAQLILNADSESEISFTLQFQDNMVGDKITAGLTIVNEDTEESYLDGEMLLLEKEEAKHLIAYLQILFDLK